MAGNGADKKVEQTGLKEFTITAVLLGVVIAVVMTAANVYLGLYAGMTVSASIPAAVIAMGVFKVLATKASLLQSNIVQTIASAGESLAAGIIFTLPALVLVGAWQEFKFWPTTIIAISGGLLGIVFMIPLRKALIVEDKDLVYPEGVACASVLESGASKEDNGFKVILKGLTVGAIFKFLGSGLKLLVGSVETAFKVGKSTIFFGLDASPALLAVGYIVRLEVALLFFAGGAVGWFIGIPLMNTPVGMEDASSLEIAWELWSTKIRYVGVGAMVVGGIWSIISVRKGIVSGLRDLSKSYRQKDFSQVKRTERDMSLLGVFAIFAVCLVAMFGLYESLIGDLALTALTVAIMFVASFIFVAVSSYIVGLVGCSNNPVSGMTISALLGTAVFFLVLGLKGDSAILATLGVAAVVCCAACTAGDCSQDLKTGSLVGATPRFQQYAQVIGVVIPAFVIAPVLTVLHSGYGIGTGLKAPQATLFASITEALFGDGILPYDMVLIGAIGGIIVIASDRFVLAKKNGFRLHLMPMAVGIYLPVTLAVPMLVGGVIRHFVDSKRNAANLLESQDKGVLLGSGLIAGEAIMGVGIAILLSLNINFGISGLDTHFKEILSLAAIALVARYLWKVSRTA